VSRRRAAPRSVVVGAVTAAATTVAWGALQQPSRPASSWQRRNYRDRDVSLLLGPALGLGALAGLAAAGPNGRRGALLVVASAAAVGAYDDLYGDRHARGLRGHARALGEGRVTTGMVKLAALVGTAALGSATEHRRPADVALNTVLVAGGANLINLFDLRPGRAAKVSLLAAAALGAGPAGQGRTVAAVAAGAALAALPSDLGERAMLGDCGAGALGALLGWSAGVGGSRRRRGVLAASVVSFTLASERVSFSEVIERQPALRALDRLGRQP
jgi:UDP-GlcNAc:undecaprenyl-phosphate GlcNAc-1-phosphate transferase